MTVWQNTVLEGKEAQLMLAELFEHLADRRLPSAAAFRNAVLGQKAVVAVNPLIMMSNAVIVDEILEAVHAAVKEGRMIDFGHIPNDVVKLESKRARDLFEAGELLHPYEAGWLGVSSWEGGLNGYYVEQWPDGTVMVIELYGVNSPMGPTLVLYDAAQIHAIEPGNTKISMAPLETSELAQAAIDIGETMEAFEEKRAANSLDPLVTMLRMLADASIPISRSNAPEKLNKARVRKGHFPIPSHDIVHTRDYVTTLTAHARARAPLLKGGHHSSPIAHWRRSHLRHLAGERVVKVRSSKVNWREGDELHRLFSKVEPRGV